MSYWFSKSDDELGDEQKWDNGVALVIPLDANRDEALERGHLLESEWFQQSAIEVDRYSEAWEMVGGGGWCERRFAITALLLQHRQP